MKARRLAAILLAILLLLGTAACGSSSKNEGTGTSTTAGTDTATQAPASDGAAVTQAPGSDETAPPAGSDGGGTPSTPARDTLYLGQTSLLGSFNFGMFGHQPTLQSWVSDTIFCWDENNNIYSNVLEDWYYEDDLTAIMKVKPGITFNTGDPLTAEDILFTLQSYTLKGSPFEPTVAWIDFENSSVSEDKLTLTLKCHEVYSPFIYVQPQPIVSKKWCEEKGWDSLDWYNNPCGSGPYKVIEYVADDHYTFERRDDYWGDISKYPYKYVVARYFGQQSSMYIALQNGEIDLAFGVSKEDYERAKADTSDDIEAVTTQGDYFSVQMWNPNGEYTKNKNVRRAIEMAIDWETIVKTINGDMALISRTAVPITSKWYDPTVETVSYDPAGAKQLLEAEGIKDGDIELLMIQTSSSEEYATLMQYYLAEVGITLTVEFVDFATMHQMLFGNVDPRLTNAFGGPAFAHPWGTLVNTIKNSTTWPEHTFVDDPYYDELTTNILHTIDETKLAELYKELQRYVAENNPYTPYAVSRAGVAYNKNVIAKAIFTNTTEANYQNIVYA